MDKKYDVIILGAGPAGMSAAIYSARYGLKTAVVSREIGGMANMAHKIENYPGYIGSGFELMQKFHKQAKEHGAEFLNDDLIDIRKVEGGFTITTTSKKFFDVKAVIIALGTQRRKLNVPGEDKFLGKGVSYCATCDGNFFKNKDVAVIGGGDSACKAAILLAGIARKVYMVYRSEKAKCEFVSGKKLGKMENVEVLYNTMPLEIRGKEVVKELVVTTSEEEEINPIKEKRIKVDGVFIEIGGLPVSDIAKMVGIKIDKEGYIDSDVDQKTNVRGIFAAGDVVKSKLKQVVIAAAQGANAAKSAHEYLTE